MTKTDKKIVSCTTCGEPIKKLRIGLYVCSNPKHGNLRTKKGLPMSNSEVVSFVYRKFVK